MAPDVPHSLRLQGILMGGVALVFARQQMYLLEDLQEMTVRARGEGRAVGLGRCKASREVGKA